MDSIVKNGPKSIFLKQVALPTGYDVWYGQKLVPNPSKYRNQEVPVYCVVTAKSEPM